MLMCVLQMRVRDVTQWNGCATERDGMRWRGRAAEHGTRDRKDDMNAKTKSGGAGAAKKARGAKGAQGARDARDARDGGFRYEDGTRIVPDDAAAIIGATLVHVPFDGWTTAALEAGAAEAGFGGDDVARLFPGGPVDAVVTHSAMADLSMCEAFNAMDEKPERVHLAIRELVLVRLEQAAPHREAVRKGVALLAMPLNAAHSARALYATVDCMWRAAGQQDTDFNFYTKRATLAAVYSATLLAWINDTSGDPAKIEAFLDRRLRDVARIPKVTAPARAVAGAFRRVAEGMFGMAGAMRR